MGEENKIAAESGGTVSAAAAAVAPPSLVMTIGQAISRYKADRETSSSPALREVINYMIDRNIKTEFSNDSYPDALALTDVMFSRSTQNIRILTGTQGDGFLQVLKESFVKALEKIKSNGGRVRIVVLGKTSKCLDELKNNYPATLEVLPAQSTGPIKHFTVCDSRMARLEEEHDELTEQTPITAVKARVYFNDPAQSKMLEDVFDHIWNRLTELIGKAAKTAPAPSSVPAAQNEALHPH